MLDDLSQIVPLYLAARDVCPKQAARLALHAREFDAWQQEYSGPAYSDSERISAWLASLAHRYQPATMNGRRASILALVRFATPDGNPLPRADRIRRQRQPDRINHAFTRDEIRQLLAVAETYAPLTQRTYGRGQHRDTIAHTRPDGRTWSDWWGAFVRVGYESGQYLSDLRSIPWSAVNSDGAVSFVRHKTGRLMAFRLSSDAIAAARKLNHPTWLLPWPYDIQAYFPRQWRRFVRAAGVRELGAKSLRRSAITYTYIAQGEEAARLLAGHASFATTARHYIDWSIATRPIVSPPPL